MAQGGERVLVGEPDPGTHQHPQRGRRGVEDGDALVLQDPVPPAGVEVGGVGDDGDAAAERAEDSVGRARDPARVGGAPVDVAGAQVEGELGRDVVGQDRLVHVDGALRLARRAAREVQQRRVVRTGGCHREGVRVVCRRPGSQRHRPRHRPRGTTGTVGTVAALGIGEQDVPEVGERVPVRLHLAEVRRCVGHEDADVAEAQSLEHRLGTERREERTVDGTGLEGAEDREVELGRPRQERADAVAGTDAQTAEGGRRDVALVAQLRVGQLGRGGGAGQEADRDGVGELALRVPVDRLVGHVEVALPVTLQPRPRRLPAEGASSRLVVADERRQRGHVLDRSPLPGAAVHCQVAHGTTVPRASRRQVGTNGPVSRDSA